MAPEPSAATQNLRTYAWEAGNSPSDETNSTGTYGRTRAVARTEALPVDTASLTGGRATLSTESASVCISSVLQKNVNYRQDARAKARKEILMTNRLPGFGLTPPPTSRLPVLEVIFSRFRPRILTVVNVLL